MIKGRYPGRSYGDINVVPGRDVVHVVDVMDQLFRLRVRSEQYGPLKD